MLHCVGRDRSPHCLPGRLVSDVFFVFFAEDDVGSRQTLHYALSDPGLHLSFGYPWLTEWGHRISK